MTGNETDLLAEKQNDTALLGDVTAALVEMYNRDAVQTPQDPWLQPVEDEQPVTGALADLYNG